MKKFFWIFGIAAMAFCLASCEEKEEPINLDDITEDGFYVVGAATGQEKVTNLLGMAKGINEANEQTVRDGMYEKYIVLEGGKEFTLAYVEGGKQEAYGATLTAFKPTETTGDYADNPSDGWFVGKLEVGSSAPKMKMEKTGLYHIVLDLNKDKLLSDAQILVSPVTWGVRGGMNNWGFTALEATAPSNDGITYTISGQELGNNGDFKFSYNGGWKIFLGKGSDDKYVKANTNLGTDCKPGGPNIVVTEGAGKYKITLNYRLAAGNLEKSFSYKIEQESKADYPAELYMTGTDFGGWSWGSDGIVKFQAVSAGGGPKDGCFVTTRYFKKDNGFKFSSINVKDDWSKAFAGMASNPSEITYDGDGNAHVPADGLWTITIDFTADKLTLNEGMIYGMGPAFNGDWTTGKYAGEVNADGTASITALSAGALRVYAPCAFDWWQHEFQPTADGKIEYREGEELPAFEVAAGDVITFDFNAGTAVVGGGAAGAIAIDGDMSDWAEIEGVTEGTHTFKAISDAKYIYLYSMRANSGRFGDIWGGTGYIYFGFDLDNNDATGDGEKADWGTGKWETLILTYPYAGSKDSPAIADAKSNDWWILPAPFTIDNMTFKGVVSEAGAEIEFRIPRADMAPIPGEEITINAWGNKDLSRAILKCTL